VYRFGGKTTDDIVHGHTFLSSLQQKNRDLKEGGGCFRLPYGKGPHVSLAGWNWHLDKQVAGRSTGQVPNATLHDFFYES
jgi:hypothetical protein